MGLRFRGDDDGALLVLHRLALDEGLAALHLVRERRIGEGRHARALGNRESFNERFAAS